MKLNKPHHQITIGAQSLYDIAALSGSAGFVSAGSVFWDSVESNNITWAFFKGRAYIYATYDIDKRVLNYNKTDFETRDDIDIIEAHGNWSVPECVALFGTAASLGIPVVCTGEYLEGSQDEEDNDQ